MISPNPREKLLTQTRYLSLVCVLFGLNPMNDPASLTNSIGTTTPEDGSKFGMGRTSRGNYGPLLQGGERSPRKRAPHGMTKWGLMGRRVYSLGLLVVLSYQIYYVMRKMIKLTMKRLVFYDYNNMQYV